MDLKELCTYLKNYPHISPKEFLEILDDQGQSRKNPLKEIYGKYVKNLRRYLKNNKIKNLKDVRLEILKMKSDEIYWSTDEDSENPLHILLIYSQVSECAANMLNVSDQTRASIMQTAQTALALSVQDVNQLKKECTKDNSIASLPRAYIIEGNFN